MWHELGIVCHKLHHLLVVDLAPSNWNVSIGILSQRSWNIIFVPFWSSNAHISYRIQALHWNIDQNMEQVQRGIFYGD